MKKLWIITSLLTASSIRASDLFKELPSGLCDDLPPSPEIPNKVMFDLQFATLHARREEFRGALRHLKAASPAERRRSFNRYWSRDRESGSSPVLVCDAIHNFPAATIPLIRLGAPIHALSWERSPLHLAAERGEYRVVRALLKAGIPPTSCSGIRDLTSLHVAKNLAVARTLIKAGANVNASTAYGETPLHYVENPDVARLLIREGANIEAKHRKGATPLHYMASFGRAAIVKILLDVGANRDARGIYGQTPLHYAAGIKKGAAAVRILLAAGASINTPDDTGITALHCAAERGGTDVMQILLDAGANRYAVDREGEMPLHKAARKGHVEIAKLLLDYQPPGTEATNGELA